MTITAASLAVEFGVEGEQQILRAVQNVDRQVQATGERGKSMLASWVSAATKFGGIMSLAVTTPLVLAGKGAIGASSDLNEAASAVTTVFGTQADAVKAFADAAAGNLGVSESAALSSASALGALFKGVGLGEQDMSKFSTNILQAGSDLGSFFNVEPSDVLVALRSGLVGESEPLRRFGILLTEDTVKAKGLELGLADAHGELSEGAKVQARYALIMEQLGSAQGDFARTADGAANSERILRAEAADLSAELGGVLLPYFQQGIGLARQLVGWISDLTPEAQRLAVAFGVVAAAAGPGLVILGQTVGAISKLAPLMAALTGPLGLVALGIAGLGLAWKNNWFGIRDVTGRVVDWLQTTFGRVIEFFQHAKDRGLTPFRLALRTLIVVLSERLGEDVPLVKALRGILRNGERFADWWLNDGSTTISNIWKQLREGDTNAAGWLIDHLFEDLQGGWERTIGPWFDDRLADAEAFGSGLVLKIKSGVESGQWAALAESLGTRLGKAAEDAGAFSEPDWQQLGADLVANTKKEIDFLSNIDQWTSEALGVGGFQISRQSMIDNGIALGRNLWENTQEELVQISLIGKWVAEQFAASDWGAASMQAIAQGEALIGGFMHGAQDWWNNQFAPWFTGLPSQIIGIFANAGDWLKAAGGNMVGGFKSGAEAAWGGVTSWVGEKVGGLPGVADEAQGASSPAKKMMPVGANAVDGITAGAAGRWSALNSALARGMGEAADHAFIPWSDLSKRHQARLMATDGPWERFSRARFDAYQASMGAMGTTTAEDGSRVPASYYGRGAASQGGGSMGRGGDPVWREYVAGMSHANRVRLRGARDYYREQGTPGALVNIARGQVAGTRAAVSLGGVNVTVNGVQDPKAIAEVIAQEIGSALGRQQTGMGIA